jgi:hypothetical protein
MQLARFASRFTDLGNVDSFAEPVVLPEPVSAVQRPTPSVFGLTASVRRVGDDGITHRAGLTNSGLRVENLRGYP